MSNKQEQQTLSADDFINVAVIGTNGSKKKAIGELFNGLGQAVSDDGKPISSKIVLTGLPTGLVGAGSLPQLPEAEYAAAQKASNWTKAQAILVAFTERLQAAQAVSEFPTIEAAIRDAIVRRCVETHGMATSDDSSKFVLNPSEIDCTTLTLKNGRTLYRFSAAAVFGALTA